MMEIIILEYSFTQESTSIKRGSLKKMSPLTGTHLYFSYFVFPFTSTIFEKNLINVDYTNKTARSALRKNSG